MTNKSMGIFTDSSPIHIIWASTINVKMKLTPTQSKALQAIDKTILNQEDIDVKKLLFKLRGVFVHSPKLHPIQIIRNSAYKLLLP